MGGGGGGGGRGETEGVEVMALLVYGECSRITY